MTESAPTLRRTWITSAMQLVAIIVGLSVMLVGITLTTRALFNDTTSQMEREASAINSIKSVLVEISVAAPPVLYAFGGPGEADTHMARYVEVRDRLTAELGAAREVFSGAEAAATLDAMDVLWAQIDDVITGAPALLASGELELTAALLDPFANTVWAPFSEMDLGLAELSQLSLVQLRDQISRFDRRSAVIAPLVVAMLALALVMSIGAGRRVSRRVLTPLVTLRDAAVTMRQTHHEQDIAIPGAAAELHDLARALNETSASLRATHSMLRDQAGTDALTGLPNRRAFVELLQHMLDHRDTERVAVLFIDLDDFKIVNDSLGHAAGDELLRVVASRLRSVARDGETVARLGGDEFAIVLSSDSAATAGAAVAERTLGALSDQVVIDGTSVEVACSIGLALSTEEPDPGGADELVRNADFAMYMAKSQGKRRYEVFAPTMHAEMVAQLELKQELGQAVRLGQLALEYQPVLELDTGGLLGFEALIRWEHPTRGRLAPAEFIPLAEDTSDIVEIGAWVVDQACAAISEHHRQQRPDDRKLWISVNVSPVELARPGYVATVNDALTRHGLPAGSLVVEISEGVAMTHSDVAAAVLRDLRAAGVHIALDDFGTGFSSLRSLHQLPIDVIKVDRSFVSSITADDESAAMFAAIVTLGHGLGLDIVAEGIETEAELARLTGHGIAGQGFWFARPLPAEDAQRFREHAVMVDGNRNGGRPLPTTSAT